LVRHQNTALLGGAAAILVARLLLLQRGFESPIEQSFGRALLGFNPFLHQPPPPSYPLYVAMGKLVNFFVHDALIALLAVSVLASLATFWLLAKSVNVWAGLVAALVPLYTVPRPDAAAVACLAAAWCFRAHPVALGVAAAAVVGVVPQTVFVVLVFMAFLAARRWQAWAAFAGMLFVEFLQVAQNIELRRMRAFVAENIDLSRTFDPLAAKAVAGAVVLAVTYHLLSAKAHHLARGADVQRGGEH
jgi:hypothetical protein